VSRPPHLKQTNFSRQSSTGVFGTMPGSHLGGIGFDLGRGGTA
jgi:hypothetical protein